MMITKMGIWPGGILRYLSANSIHKIAMTDKKVAKVMYKYDDSDSGLMWNDYCSRKSLMKTW